MTGKGNQFAKKRREWEERFIRRELEQHDWSVSETARILGLGRSEMNAVLRRLGINAAEVKMRRNAALTPERVAVTIPPMVSAPK